jgi:hypothetical protein
LKRLVELAGFAVHDCTTLFVRPVMSRNVASRPSFIAMRTQSFTGSYAVSRG